MIDDDNLDKMLWDKVPRIKQELSFGQIKAVANFFANIVDYKSPFTSTHSIGVADCAEKLARYMGFDEETVEKMYLAGALLQFYVFSFLLLCFVKRLYARQL